MKNTLVNVVKLSEQLCKKPIQCHLAYANKENFLGRVVDGYHKNAAHIGLLAPKTAQALCEIQNTLNRDDLGLFIFDGFRPLRAVQDFGNWMNNPIVNDDELARKKIHYPDLEKNQLTELGYIAGNVSNHCFGDTVDLSIVDLKTQQLIDMGVCFDYFGNLAHTTTNLTEIGEISYNNRQKLNQVMLDAGFSPYEKEYWHFTFEHREFEQPLDFEITEDLA